MVPRVGMRLRGRRRRDRARDTDLRGAVGRAVQRRARRRAVPGQRARRVRGRRRGKPPAPGLRSRSRRALQQRREDGARGGADRCSAATAPYDYIHSFWSDQYEHKLEYVGHATKWDAVRRPRELGGAEADRVLPARRGSCWRPSASTAAGTPSWTPTRRWRHARASWPQRARPAPGRARRRARGPVVAKRLRTAGCWPRWPAPAGCRAAPRSARLPDRA